MRAKYINEIKLEGPSKKEIQDKLKDRKNLKFFLETNIESDVRKVEFTDGESKILIIGSEDIPLDEFDIPYEDLQYLERPFEYEFNALIDFISNEIKFNSETEHHEIGGFFSTYEDNYKSKTLSDDIKDIPKIINKMIKMSLYNLDSFISDFFQDDI